MNILSIIGLTVLGTLACVLIGYAMGKRYQSPTVFPANPGSPDEPDQGFLNELMEERIES